MKLILLVTFLVASVASGKELPVGLIVEGCPSPLSSPDPDFSMDDVLNTWYLHSVGNLPLMKLQHGECFTANYFSRDDGYTVVNTYEHEGTFIEITGRFFTQGPGKITYEMADNSNPTIIVDVVADDHLILYTCEEDLLDGGNGFGQIWFLTKSLDVDVQDLVDLDSFDVNGYSIPQLTRMRQGGDCSYPEGF